VKAEAASSPRNAPCVFTRTRPVDTTLRSSADLTHQLGSGGVEAYPAIGGDRKRPRKNEREGSSPGPWSAATAGQGRKETLAYNQAAAISLWELSVRGVLAEQLTSCVDPVLSSASRLWAVIRTSCNIDVRVAETSSSQTIAIAPCSTHARFAPPAMHSGAKYRRQNAPISEFAGPEKTRC